MEIWLTVRYVRIARWGDCEGRAGMTREEAINIMSQMIKDEEGFLSDNTVEAHKMAIQALSQEPCDDAISREAALEKMADYVASGYADSAEDFEEYSRIICQLPSVTPQKHGKWIVHPEIETSTPEYLMFYECSKCGDKQCFCKSDIHKKRFCNNCGAKMVEPQESEEV